MPQGDVYQIDGIPKDARPMLKKSLQIMINSRCEDTALKKIKRQFPKKYYPNLFKELSHMQIIDAFKNKHQYIDKYFYSGFGVKLQYIDSQVAEEILNYFAMRDIVVLPIHDGFRIQTYHKENLIAVMVDVLERKYGQKFKYDVDQTGYEKDMDVLRENIPDDDIPETEEEYEEEWVSHTRCKEYYSRLEEWRASTK